MSLTDRQFLAAHLAEFRSDVLGNLDTDELFLLFEDRLELGVLIAHRYSQWREAVEADEAIERMEHERRLFADRRQRG